MIFDTIQRAIGDLMVFPRIYVMPVLDNGTPTHTAANEGSLQRNTDQTASRA